MGHNNFIYMSVPGGGGHADLFFRPDIMKQNEQKGTFLVCHPIDKIGTSPTVHSSLFFPILKGQHDKALLDCNQAILIDPQSSIAYWVRGEACENLGHKNEAIDAYRKVIALAPSNSPMQQEAQQRLSVLIAH